MSLRYLSVCSGIEAASVAWHSLGFVPVAFSEIEPFPCSVLKHHYPTIPNLGDMTKYHDWPQLSIDLLVGGTPCQAFSVAGLRKGLADPRGNLTLVFLGIVDRFRPRWVVWENVPGVLSDKTGAFGSLLGGLGQLGYGWAYRVLDAQYFGVAQRRRRVFVVGHLGAWQRAAAVLFEPESLRWDTAPSREAGEGVAGRARSRTSFCLQGGGMTSQNSQGSTVKVEGAFTLNTTDVHGVATWPAQTAPTLDAHYGDKQGLDNQHINAGGGCSSPTKCLTSKTQRNDFETETLILCKKTNH